MQQVDPLSIPHVETGALLLELPHHAHVALEGSEVHARLPQLALAVDQPLYLFLHLLSLFHWRHFSLGGGGIPAYRTHLRLRVHSRFLAEHLFLLTHGLGLQ